jgi:hypothetical protein
VGLVTRGLKKGKQLRILQRREWTLLLGRKRKINSGDTLNLAVSRTTGLVENEDHSLLPLVKVMRTCRNASRSFKMDGTIGKNQIPHWALSHSLISPAQPTANR